MKTRAAYNEYREKLILEVMNKLGACTVNEVINFIWDADRAQKTVYKRGWRFYVHLNKFPAVMSRKKLIEFTGEYKRGDTGVLEKVWRGFEMIKYIQCRKCGKLKESSLIKKGWTLSTLKGICKKCNSIDASKWRVLNKAKKDAEK